MRLRKLHIEDYKMFKDFDISFADELVKSFYFFLKEKDYRPSEVKNHFDKYMKDIFDGLDLTFSYSYLDKEDNVWFNNDTGEEYTNIYKKSKYGYH